jgi:ubiquinone biosynthesis protein
LLERAGRALHWDGAAGLATKAPQQHFREALEDLGPVFVKLGQILSGRSDLLPPEWTEELARLQERSTPVPYEKIRAQLVQDLGAPPEEAFADFHVEPLSAASIAQVHRASLPDGTPVVLKIRRPGIERTAEADLRLLKRLAETIELEMPELRRYRPKSLVRQFSRSLRAELDLRIEARNAERLAAGLPEGSRIVVPRIHQRFTRERLCVMDYVAGQSLGEWIRTGMPGDVRPSEVARLGAETILHMVLVDGFYHADPHPGNVILMPDGRLGMLDFGMVGRLSEERRLQFLQLLHAIVERREDDVVEILLDWSEGGETDAGGLAIDSAAFVDRYYGLPLERLDVTELLMDVAALLRDNDLYLPNDVALLLKVFVTLDSLGRQLDPEFVMAEHVAPFAERVLREHGSPVAVVRRNLRELARTASSFPRDVRRLAGRMRRGNLRLAIEVRDLRDFGHQLDRSANRLTVGLVTAALIVGTSIALTVPGGPHLLGLPLFSLLGFLSSAAAGVWLLWSILRSGRR